MGGCKWLRSSESAFVWTFESTRGGKNNLEDQVFVWRFYSKAFCRKNAIPFRLAINQTCRELTASWRPSYAGNNDVCHVRSPLVYIILDRYCYRMCSYYYYRRYCCCYVIVYGNSSREGRREGNVDRTRDRVVLTSSSSFSSSSPPSYKRVRLYPKHRE